MASKLQIKKSSETGKVPQPADLDWGELAINYTDGKLFYKQNGSNSIQEINTPATGAAAHKTWASLGSNGAAARRHTIARVYGTPNHWTDTWQNIRIKLIQEGYSSGYLEYNLIGYYGMGNGASWILRLKDADGLETGNFQVTLGTPTAAGWDYAGQPTYYQDVYVEVAYYLTVRVVATTYGHGFQTANPTDGSNGCYTVFYTTPDITDGITYSTVSQNSTYHLDNKIWNAGNDGSGSGLDADLLDGNHASAFYLASNPSGYTSNTGTVTSVGGTGTVSGLTLSGTVTGSGNLTLGGAITGFLPTTGGTVTGATIIQSSLSVQQYNEASYRKWHYSWGGSQDLNWYRVATLRSTVTDGWRGTSGKITVFDENSNHGVATRTEYTAYFTAHYSSGGSALDAGYIYFGPGASNYIRLFKVGTRHYEVQVRQIADWKLMGAILEIDEDTGNASVFDTSLQSPSATGTVVSSSGSAAENINILGVAAALSTARTITIGNTGRTFDGSANVSWTLSDIGAAASNHAHDYLALSGGTLTGNLEVTGNSPYVKIRATSGGVSYLWLNDGTSNGYLIKNTTNATDNGALAGALYTYTDSNKAFQHIHSGTPLFTILSNGNTGIGTVTPAYKLEVNGSFAATTKSFVIDHPTKSGKKLRYGSLEGPENGVYVRGRLRGTKIELPDYWTKLVDPDSITVQLTPHGRRQDIWVTKVENNCVYVQGTTQPDCYYFIQAERVDVEKLQVELDA